MVSIRPQTAVAYREPLGRGTSLYSYELDSEMRRKPTRFGFEMPEEAESMQQEKTSAGVIALDVGGTSVKSALVFANGTLASPPRTSPLDAGGPADAILADLVAVIVDHAHEAAQHEARLSGIGFGFPGPFDYAAGISWIKGLTKFESLYGLNVGDELRRRLPPDLAELPIRFRNDAEVAIVGEALYGAASDYARVIGVTLGTGFGSAFLVDGVAMVDGPGVPPNGWLYPCLFNGLRADDRFSIRGLNADLTAAGVTSASVQAAAAAARRREPRASAVFDQFAHDLGAFLRPWVEEFQAHAVLFQGGIARSFDLLESNLVTALPVPVVAGELGASAALLGAASSFLHVPPTH